MTTGLSRALLGGLALGGLVGCGGSTDFEITETYRIQGTGSIAASEEVRLADVAGEAWDQRDKIDDLNVKSAVATITAVAPTNTAPSGTLVGEVSRGSQSAEVVNGSGPIQIGTRLEGQNLGPASDLVMDAIEGDGLLSVEVLATIPPDTTADFTVQVVMVVEAEWSLW
jgi:hypothetical protein